MKTMDPRETRLQAMAEDAERRGVANAPDAQVAAYRLVHRAIRMAPVPAAPAGFAARVARIAAEPEQRDGNDLLLVTLCALLVLAGAAVFALPTALQAFGGLTDVISGAPWPMLATAAAVMLGLLAFDGVAALDRTRSGG